MFARRMDEKRTVAVLMLPECRSKKLDYWSLNTKNRSDYQFEHFGCIENRPNVPNVCGFGCNTSRPDVLKRLHHNFGVFRMKNVCLKHSPICQKKIDDYDFQPKTRVLPIDSRHRDLSRFEPFDRVGTTSAKSTSLV